MWKYKKACQRNYPEVSEDLIKEKKQSFHLLPRSRMYIYRENIYMLELKGEKTPSKQQIFQEVDLKKKRRIFTSAMGCLLWNVSSRVMTTCYDNVSSTITIISRARIILWLFMLKWLFSSSRLSDTEATCKCIC